MIESHFKYLEGVMLAQSKIAGIAGHTNLRGSPREWFIRDFLTDNLPSSLEIGQGEIIDETSLPAPRQGDYRNQVDIVIYRRDLPKLKYSSDNAAYLAEGVIATIESKSELTEKELKKACIACGNHRRLIRTPPHETLGPPEPNSILSYVVAYAGPAGIKTVAKWLPKISDQLGVSNDDMPDMIIVLGKGVVLNKARFPKINTPSIPVDHNWAFIKQESKNLLMLFMHFLTWSKAISSRPDTENYVDPMFWNTFDSL